MPNDGRINLFLINKYFCRKMAGDMSNFVLWKSSA